MAIHDDGGQGDGDFYLGGSHMARKETPARQTPPMTSPAPSEMELKPSACPFCGGDSIECHPNDIARYGHNMAGATTADLHYTHCNGCGAEGPGAHSYQEAIELHNRRSPCRREVLEKVAYEVDKALENGSPRETWSEAEIAVDRAREEALEAIHALATEEE